MPAPRPASPVMDPPARSVYPIEPLRDPRWSALVAEHPRSSVFHSVAWLEALQRTYGYQPIAYTTSPAGGRLENGLLFCRVNSWITGRRLVSLPFSDHCEPLADREAVGPLAEALQLALRTEKLRYVEIRPRSLGAVLPAGWRPAQDYCFHELDLRPDPDTLFRNFHKSSTQRKIQRAEREGLTCESGRSAALLDAFWDLLLLTRRRHAVPPQPKAWFQNLVDCFGQALTIRVAFQGRRPAAAILTISHKDTLVYKYGCSDASLSHLGGTQLLFWRAIQEARRDGLLTLDLGRSDCDNPGLITFKDRWGAARSTLTYSRFSASPGAGGDAGAGWGGRIAKVVAPRLPGSVLRLAGRMLYRHIA
jgi:CelD/BcsL family acetyltransferase involved in cellulose biosynthesis